MFGQPLRTSFDQGLHSESCIEIALTNVLNDLVEFFQGGFAPDQPQHFPDLSASSLRRILAIASSCGPGGRVSASEASTLALNQRS
jgi:hypothetical protein